MRIEWMAAATIAALVVGGCGAYMPPPVQVVGEPANLQQLAGSWHGTFRNTQLRRKGQIDFQMNATSDSAFGEVRLYTDNPNQPVWSVRPQPGTAANSAAPPPWLRIRFVRVENGYVSGEMEPMFEPSCQCYVTSKFLGRVRGDLIEGSFTSRSPDGRFESSGNWRAERTAAASK